MSLKSTTKPNSSIPTTAQDLKKNIERLLTKAEGYKEQIAILKSNKAIILQEKHSISQILQKGDSSRKNSLERKNKQIERIDEDIQKYDKYIKKIIKEIENSALSLKESKYVYELPKPPSHKIRSTAKGIKKLKRKKTKKKKTKKKNNKFILFKF
jgi:Na+/phosphate symporter